MPHSRPFLNQKIKLGLVFIVALLVVVYLSSKGKTKVVSAEDNGVEEGFLEDVKDGLEDAIKRKHKLKEHASPADVPYESEDEGGKKGQYENLKIEPPKSFEMPENAYVFVLDNDLQVQAVWTVEASLRNVSAKYRRVALVTPSVSRSMRNVLKALNIQVVPIKRPPHALVDGQNPRLKYQLAKLDVLDLKELAAVSKFIYLDSDTIVNYNIDSYFEFNTERRVYGMKEKVACNEDPEELNSGFFVGSPNPNIKTQVLKMLELEIEQHSKGNIDALAEDSLLHPLERFLTRSDAFSLLPESEVAFLWRCDCVQQQTIPAFKYNETKVIHFTQRYLDMGTLVKNGLSGRLWMPRCAYPVYERWYHLQRDLQIWWTKTYNIDPPDLPLRSSH